jgi:hypothetical protein
MKSISRLILASSVALVALWAADATGKWTGEMQGRNGNTMNVSLNLKADGAKLTGTVGGQNGDTEISDGKVDGDSVSFTVVREFNGNQIKQNYKGKLDGDTIHFSVTREGGNGGGQPRTFDAHRATT